MALTTVTATHNGKDYAVGFDFGDNCEDANKKFTPEVVYSNFVSSAIIRFRAVIKAWAKAGKDVTQLTTTWKPGIQMQRATPDAATMIKSLFASYSKEEKAEFLKDMKNL